MPSYLWAIIGAGSVLVICGIVCLITYTVRKKNNNNFKRMDYYSPFFLQKIIM